MQLLVMWLLAVRRARCAERCSNNLGTLAGPHLVAANDVNPWAAAGFISSLWSSRVAGQVVQDVLVEVCSEFVGALLDLANTCPGQLRTVGLTLQSAGNIPH